ncbi:unnamed protein product [Ranitomeya imitator]|uniref:Cytosolic fatty-acid binding proteins domain-containing protein n=1 Tax=Ranitomeya imitator TaxID=111125 RepID=A0ABN9LEJ3_9NEOB|nr:unnamed protein product [Ranitomeya imitator]
MSFAGTYELQSHENFEVFMKAIGLPDELIQIGKDIKSVTKIEQNGDHFVVTVTTGPKVLRNEFDIGKESEIETLTEEKIKTTVNIVDGKLVVQLKSVKSVTELSGDILTNVMTLRDIVYKRICCNLSTTESTPGQSEDSTCPEEKRGWNPELQKNGETKVAELARLLRANSANGKNDTQSSWSAETKHLRYVSKV